MSASIPTTASNQVTATLSGLTAGDYCNLEYRANITGGATGNWGSSNTIAVYRGNTYTFQARNSNLQSGTAGIVSSASTYVGYLAPYLAIGRTAVLTSDENGGWTQQITGISGNYNRYSARLNNGTVLYRAGGGLLATAVGGSFIINDVDGNTPQDATTTYQIWASRTTSSGGQNNWHNTNVTFQVEREDAESHNESISNPAGTYFDNLAGTGAEHSVTLGGLTSGYYYNISTSSSNINTALSTWTNAWAFTKIPNDSGASDPGSNNTTTTTYYLWRSAFSNGSSPTYTGDSYTRTIASYSRFTMADVGISGTNTFTQTVENAINGHTYYIKSPGGAIVGQGTSTVNGNFNISVTVGVNDIPNVDDTVVHTLYSQSPYNSSTTTEYSTGQTYTVTRTGTSSGGAGASSSTFGLEVYTASGTLLYGTTSRIGRVMASGRIPSSGTINNGVSVTETGITGLTNSTDFNIIVLPEVGSSGGVNYTGYNFSIAKGTNQFTLTNNSGYANAYNYTVLKTGGT